MGIYDQFKMDRNAEKEGIYYEVYDEDGEDLFRVKIARAGGANKRFDKAVDFETKKYKRIIANDSMSAAKSRKVMIEVYAQTVILDWELKIDGKWVQGVDVDAEGNVIPFNRQNVIDKLIEVEELYNDIVAQANQNANFKRLEQEQDAKN